MTPERVLRLATVDPSRRRRWAASAGAYLSDRALSTALLVTASPLLCSLDAEAHVRKLGNEFQVSQYTTLGQQEPSIATIGSDEFLIVWAGSALPSARLDIRAQRYHRSGELIGEELVLSKRDATPFASFDMPDISARTDGSFVLAWSRNYSLNELDILYAQFDPTGTQVGDEVLVGGYGRQRTPSVSTREQGGFLVVWQDAGTTREYRAVTHARFVGADESVVDRDLVLPSTPGLTRAPDTTTIATGQNTLAVWSGEGVSDSTGVYGRIINSTGDFVGTEFRINSTVIGSQGRPEAASQSSGYVVVWQSNSDERGVEIRGQRLGTDGAPVGEEFQINQYTTDHQGRPRIASASNGNFVVIWESYDTVSGGPAGQDGDGRGIFGRAFDDQGRPLGSEFQVNTYTTGDQGTRSFSDMAVSMFPDGDFVVVWNSQDQDGSYTGVFGQRFRFDPSLGPLCGDAAGNELTLTVADAQLVLQGAVGLAACALCVCDVDNSGNVTAQDALLVLGAAVELPRPLNCPACSQRSQS